MTPLVVDTTWTDGPKDVGETVRSNRSRIPWKLGPCSRQPPLSRDHESPIILFCQPLLEKDLTQTHLRELNSNVHIFYLQLLTQGANEAESKLLQESADSLVTNNLSDDFQLLLQPQLGIFGSGGSA